MNISYRKAWKGEVLGELLDFIARQHDGCIPSLKDISKITGLSVGNISAMFLRDDMKLSRMEEIVNCYGYKLKLFFPLREYPVKWNNAVEQKKYPNAGNLQGLVEYLHDSNITVNYMACRIGRTRFLIESAFNSGDIFLSTLKAIIENLNIEILWIYEPLTIS